MKYFIIIATGLMLSACGSTNQTVFNEWYVGNTNPSGLTSYDPPNGDWIFISNEPGGDYMKRTQNWDWSKGTPPRY